MGRVEKNTKLNFRSTIVLTLAVVIIGVLNKPENLKFRPESFYERLLVPPSKFQNDCSKFLQTEQLALKFGLKTPFCDLAVWLRPKTEIFAQSNYFICVIRTLKCRLSTRLGY
jgi:hypothetical protein